jgi:hypothetical protein
VPGIIPGISVFVVNMQQYMKKIPENVAVTRCLIDIIIQQD